MFCASRQDRRLRGLFPIASRRKLCKHWATVSQKVMSEGKTIGICFDQKNEGLDRSIKIWKRFRACALGNLIHTWYYLVLFLYPACRKCLVLLYTGLDGYHHSGSFCDFLEAFKQTYIVKPKTTRDLKEFFWANFTHFRQKAKKILSFREHTDLNFGNQ